MQTVERNKRVKKKKWKENWALQALFPLLVRYPAREWKAFHILKLTNNLSFRLKTRRQFFFHHRHGNKQTIGKMNSKKINSLNMKRMFIFESIWRHRLPAIYSTVRFFPVPILNFTEKNIRVKEKFFRRSLHFTHKQRPCHFELDSPLLCRFKNDWFIFSPLAQSHTLFCHRSVCSAFLLAIRWGIFAMTIFSSRSLLSV